MNQLVQIHINDDGDETNYPHRWHLVDPCNRQGRASLCTSEFFGIGESACEFTEKESLRGGIDCPDCLKIIRAYKKVKL